MNKTYNSDQHTPLKIPQKWEDIRPMVIQLENLLNTVYRRLGQLERKVKALEEAQEE